jgi:AmmeMemoRadiSam system protein B
VGELSAALETAYGAIFAPYLADPHTLFVASSDFCHWGKRFRYTCRDPACAAIHESIEKTDRDGMAFIEALNPCGFAAYLEKTKNTICGRRPIALLIQARLAFFHEAKVFVY